MMQKRQRLVTNNMLMMLPDDLILNCLARISRSYYPTLSLVSKRFRSLLASKELHQTRILLGRCAERCLYVCFGPNKSNIPLRWSILCPVPNSSEKVLVPIPSPYFSSVSTPGVVRVGTDIYAIGGGPQNNPSRRVMVLDSLFHTWREAPSMRVARASPSVCAVDGTIYVTGGCDGIDPTNWMETFDTKTQTWEFLQIPSDMRCKAFKHQSIGYEGSAHVHVSYPGELETYKLHRGKWRKADIAITEAWCTIGSSCCVIDNVLYGYRGKRIDWYDSNQRQWKTVQGLEGLFSLPGLTANGNVKLADHDGKMAIMWEDHGALLGTGTTVTIWCAEITLERRQNWERWGTLGWSGNVFTTTYERLRLLRALTSTVC